MQKKRYFSVHLFSLFLLAVCLHACSGSQNTYGRDRKKEWLTANGKLKVLSTIGMIDDLVNQVGGEYADSITLIKRQLDPHSYQLVKGDGELIAAADIIFYNGLGLEHGPSMQKQLLESPKAVGLGNLIKNEYPESLLSQNGLDDPHIWMDIAIWQKTVPHIVSALSRKDPAHAAYYQKNGSDLIETMKKAHVEIQKLMHSVPESTRFLVTSHDAFNYFARSYLAEDSEKAGAWKKRFNAPEGLAPESQLSTADIQSLVEHLEKYKIHVLFPESTVSKDSIRKIVEASRSKGLHVRIACAYLYADALGAPESESGTYLQMMKYNAETIAKNLKNSDLPNCEQ